MRACALFALTSILLCAGSFAQTRGGGSRGPTVTPSPPAPSPNRGPIGGGSAPVPLTSANDEGKIEFRTQSILVQVPVIVTDKSGNHIHGLTKNDLHSFENGKEQPISVLEEMVSSNAKVPPPPTQPGEFRNLTISEDQPRNITVIALDTVNTPFLDQTNGRRELVKYLANNVDPTQVLALMIITSRGLRVIQGLTGDPEQLAQILKKVSGELPAMQTVNPDIQADVAAGDAPGMPTPISPGSDPTAAMQAFVDHGDALYAQFAQQNAIETTLNGFMGIAWTLSGLPGRKSLIWATGGFPFTIGEPATVPGGYLSTLYERTMQALLQAQISVYPVDVRGLVTASPLVDATRSGVPSMRSVNNRSWLQQSKIDTLKEFAEMTGGKAFYNTNDLATSFKRAAEDASSYYMLGYYLDLHNNHAGWRNLKVKVDRKDIEVRARKGFFVTNATLHMDLTRGTDLNFALTSPIEGTGVPIDVKWLGVSGDGTTKKAGFLVRLPFNALMLDPSGQNKVNFDFAVAAYPFKSKDGKPASTLGKSFAPSLTEAQVAEVRAKGVGFNYALDLAPGQYTVRFVVRDNVSGKIGSLTAPLTVN
ncbi:MAG TPA: VWA domain-containing protein [Verrucomicrobiae bacterium]|nr:VWA domain-containing protein [Verrucomicrobiae bacterium]